MGVHINKFLKSLSSLTVVLALLAFQLVPLGAFWNNTAEAAEICATDVEGANDEPGQKDLNKMCFDSAGQPTYVDVSWHWDDTAWSGGNTGDACALFDSDNDGNANYAFCVIIGGNPAAQLPGSPLVYSCNDTREDRCAAKQLVTKNYISTCIVANGTDPFPTGDFNPNDTKATCRVYLSDFSTDTAPATAKMIDVCSYPSQEPNSDPSDCVIATDKATVEVIKLVEPSSSTDTFDLFIDSTRYVDNGLSGSTTGPHAVDDTLNVVVKEEPGSNLANFDGYTTTVTCVDQANKTVATGTPTGSGSRQLTIPASAIAAGDDIICTFTNTRNLGYIKVVKDVINDNGGTKTYADFTFKLDNGTAQNFEATTSPDGQKLVQVNTGNHSVVEVEANTGGYSTTYNNCANITVTVLNSSTNPAICTITNNDTAGQIRVIKNVVNDNGGNAVSGDFTLLVNGQAKSQNQYFSANAGTYTVTESTVSGYTMTGIACVNDANSQSVAHPVQLGLGQSVTCIVTNDDSEPSLTVVKNVTNDNGGTVEADDFLLRLNGNELSSPVLSNSNLTATYSIADAQSNTSYTVSEDAFSGYAGSSVSCVDNGTQQAVAHPVILNEGQSVTCSITNNDIAPLLTVIKTVTNDNGGTLVVTDFPLFVGNVQVTSGQQNSFNAGLVVVSETNQAGYTAGSWGGDCDLGGNITLQVGGVYTCTITNNDQPATIIVNKVVVNDNGGNAKISDFTLKVNTTTVNPGATNTFNGNALYTISETGPTGYTQTSLVCQDITDANNPIVVANPFTAQLGHTYNCTITNNDNAPTLTIVKKVVNDSGGTATVADFDIKNNNTNLSFNAGVVNGSETTYTATPIVAANTDYTLSEIDFAGYSEGIWSCSDNTTGTGLTVMVNLDEGENVTCTVTNNDQVAKLVLQKTVVNDDGGTLTAANFPVYIDGQSASWGDNQVNADSYVVSETTKTGYSPSVWGGDCDAQGNVTLGPGQTKTCTITNDDIAPTLTLKKVVVNDNGGNNLASEWTLIADGDDGSQPINTTGTTIPDSNGLEAKTAATKIKAEVGYTLTETGPTGYTAGDWICDGGRGMGNIVHVPLGANVTCTITNDDKAPQLTVVKQVVNDNGGNAIASDFTMKVNGTTLTDPVMSNANHTATYAVIEQANVAYTVSEIAVSGYVDSTVSCSDDDLTQPVTHPVTLSEGQNVTCTITNDDVAPKLSLIKYVNNDNGGDEEPNDWSLSATPTSGSVISGNGSVEEAAAVANNAYALAESGPDGYEVSIDWNCDGGSFNADTNKITLNEGDDVTCTITNDDIAPKLTLYKIVVDEYGDEAEPENWILSATPISGTTLSGDGEDGFVDKAAVAHMTYVLSEDGPNGYTASNWACTSTAGVFSEPDGNGTVRMTEGADVTCYITNTSVAPVLVVIKNLIQDNGGNKSEANFTMNVSGSDVSDSSFPGEKVPGTTVTLDAGAYLVTEEAAFGYDTSYSTDCSGTIDVGQLKTCTVTNNDKPPVVYVEKQTYPDGSEQVFTFNVTNNGANYSGNIGLSDGGVYDTGYGLDAGNVTVTEQATAGWFITFANCFETEVAYGENEEPIFEDTLPGVGTNFTAEIGKAYHCRYENEQAGKIMVTKFNDLDEDGYKDDSESTLEGWEMNLARDDVTEQETTGLDGSATFDNLKSGSYILSETFEDDWLYSNIYCEYPSRTSYGYVVEDNNFHVHVAPGETINCYVGNSRVPYFLLEKFNDKPDPVLAGTDVKYTLVLTVPEDSGRIYGLGCNEETEEFYLFDALGEASECERPVKVVDLPPKNFTYIAGSWTAHSNIRGDLKAQGITDDPAYASPGTWVLTNSASPYLSPGEVITLTYLAKIGNVVPGTYPDLATAIGFSRSGDPVLANINETNQTNPFVSSEVTVYEPEVLGVATLENTGSDGRLVTLTAGIVLLSAVLLAIFSRRHKGMVAGLAVTSAIAIAGFGIAPKADAAAFWTVNMSKPAANTDKATINVDWQLATALPEQQPGETFTVTLLQNGSPTGATQQVTNPNGDSGTFSVTLPAEGTYNLQVHAISNLDAEVKTSSATAVTFDATPPTAPVIVGKVQNGNDYTVTIKIPEGVEPGTLEIYASPNTSFTADGATLIGSVAYTPGQTVTFSFTKPGSEYYVAARIVDQNGNASPIISENRTRAVAAAAAAVAAATTDGTVGDASSTTDEADVLSETDGSPEEQAEENEGLSTVWWIVIILAVLGTIAGAVFYNSQRSERR